MLQNPFLIEPLEENNMDLLYVKRLEEDKVLNYILFDNTVQNIKKTHNLFESRNFIVIGARGHGKTTFLNRLSSYILNNEMEPRPTVIIPQVKNGSLKEFLGRIYVDAISIKKSKSYEEERLLENFKNTCSYRAFTLDFLINQLQKYNLVVFIDNAQTIFKYTEILQFLTSMIHTLNIQWGLFMTPKAYYTWCSNKDGDGFFDRFNLTLTLMDLTFDQVKEMIIKRLSFRGLNAEDMIDDSQITRIVSSLNGAPRPIIKTCRILYEKSIRMSNEGKLELKKMTDFDIINAVAIIKLEELDITELDEDYKRILHVFMVNEGVATTKDLLSAGLTRPTLYRKLTYLRQKGYVYPQIDESGNEQVGKWELDPSTSSILTFGANGEFSKPFKERD